MNLRPREVWLADLGLAAKTRPVVIVSREDEDAPRALAIYLPLTTQNRKSPYEVEIPKLAFLNEVSWPMYRESLRFRRFGCNANSESCRKYPCSQFGALWPML